MTWTIGLVALALAVWVARRVILLGFFAVLLAVALFPGGLARARALARAAVLAV